MGAVCTKGNEDVGKMKEGVVTAGVTAIDDAALDRIGGGGLKQKLILRFACISLPNLDVGSKTDPFIVLWGI